jgi:hypothetical protein
MKTEKITLMCQGKCPRCPEITIREDGSAVIEDNDVDPPQRIELKDREQVVLLRDFLIKKTT